MTEKSKSDIAPQKRTLKLSPSLGDWTSYRPSRSLIKRIKVGLYGFDRLSDDELKESHLIHYRFGESLLRNLKINFKIGGELYAVEAMQTTYGGFAKVITGPLLQAKVDLPEFHDEITVCFDMNLTSTLINSSLGMKDTKNLGGELTEAEKIVVENSFIEYMDASLGASFRDVLPGTHFELVTSPDFSPNPYTGASSTFVYFTVEFSIGDSIGKMVLGYSGQLLKSVLKKMKLTEKPKPLSLNRVKSDILTKTRIPVTVVLGTTELKGNEIYQLEMGDVVSLDNSIHNAIQIRIAESGTVVMAQPGIKDGKLIVRVVGVEKEKEIKVAPPLPVVPPETEALEEMPVMEENVAEEVPAPQFPEEVPETPAPESFLEEETMPEEEISGEETAEETPEEEFNTAENEENPQTEDFGITDEDFKDEDFKEEDFNLDGEEENKEENKEENQ